RPFYRPGSFSRDCILGSSKRPGGYKEIIFIKIRSAGLIAGIFDSIMCKHYNKSITIFISSKGSSYTSKSSIQELFLGFVGSTVVLFARPCRFLAGSFLFEDVNPEIGIDVFFIERSLMMEIYKQL